MRRIALAWLHEVDWAAWRSIDARLEAEYPVWLAKNTKAAAILEKQGNSVTKVLIEPDEFLAWHRTAGAGTDADARAEFARIKTRDNNHRR